MAVKVKSPGLKPTKTTFATQPKTRPVTYNPSAYVRGGATPAVTQATQNLGYTSAYNPSAYVRGGASPAVAKAIQTAGLAHPAAAPLAAHAAAIATKQGAGGGGAAAAGTNPMLNRLLARYMGQLLTPAQMKTQATQSVNDQVTAALAGMRASTAAEQAAYTKQQQRAQGFALAMANLSGQNEASALQNYRQAAQDIQGLGTGLTGTVGQAQQQQADQAAAQINALTQGRNTATGLDVPGMQNVAQYTGVTLPSADLYTQAASQAGLARYNTQANADRISQIATDYAQKWQDAQHTLTLNRQALEATRPGLYREAMNTLQSGSRQDMASLVSALTLQNTMAGTNSMINSRSISDAINKALAPLKVKQAGANVAATTAKTTGLISDGKGGWKLAPNYHWSSTDPKTRTPTYFDPKKWQLDPKDPTHTKIVPLPGTVKKQYPDWQNPDGTMKGTYYRPGPGQRPLKIPGGMMVDPKNPHNLIPTRTGTKKGPGGLSAASQNTAINNAYRDFTKSVKAPPFAVVTPASKLYGTSISYAPNPKWTFQQAEQQALSTFPAWARKRPDVISKVDQALESIGYKRAAPVKKKPAKSAGGGFGDVTRITPKPFRPKKG